MCFYYTIVLLKNQQKCKNVEKWVHKCRNLSSSSRQTAAANRILPIKQENFFRLPVFPHIFRIKNSAVICFTALFLFTLTI
ncbi:MAG TPA: hypothetical protein DCQ76_02315 [Ruminococcaceae bacterium]|nr:hypothetical protein [Oscillospiraceae bacterium]